MMLLVLFIWRNDAPVLRWLMFAEDWDENRKVKK